MAEMVGGALLSGFIDVLFQRLATKEVLNFIQGKKVNAELLDELRIKLFSANKLLNDAEEKQLTDQDVKNWLDKLTEVLYEAEHVIDKISTEAMRGELQKDEPKGEPSKFFNFIPMLFVTAFEDTVNSKMKEIVHKLKLLLDRNEFLGLKEVDPKIPLGRLLVPLVEESVVYGREYEKEAIVKLLLSDNVGGHRISIIPIVGMGGMGKTTLAKLIYEDRRLQGHFDLKVWITISEEFDVPKIAKVIFEVTTRRFYVNDLHQLQQELKKALLGKKFLFILDGVGNGQHKNWDIVKGSFESGAHGSKIIVTTRSEVVAARLSNGVQTYNLQTISDDDCWKFFEKHVFNNHIGFGVPSDLKEVAIEIVKKCKGVPLAVKLIAGLLRSDPNPKKWRSILQSNIWKFQFQENQKNKILPSLWLSYKFLPSQLKRCFSYCSIFPKGYEFYEDDREKIILLWMAEGLLQPENGKTMEDVGEAYLNALISRSFFQRSNENKSSIFMHDLVHDLATCVSGNFFCALDNCNISNYLKTKTFHLLCGKSCKDIRVLCQAKCLRTFLALPLSCDYSYESTLTQEVFGLLLKVGEGLRVLSLSQSYITMLPESIGNLKHLRYLDLSWLRVRELPNSICTLYNLQTLLLSNCRDLTQLPSNMSNLISLRHLDITCTSLKEMPPQMQNMTNLQSLSDFILGQNDGSRIKELEKLHLLHGSLLIKGLENVVDVNDVLEANLKRKGLTEIILCWGRSNTYDSRIEEAVFSALQPHKNLKELSINDYKGTIFADWIADDSYCNIVKVNLAGCKNCCLLPSFGQLPSLKELIIGGNNGVASIGDEFCGSSLTKPFPSLESLRIHYMNSLEKWSFTKADKKDVFLPCLKELDLIGCSNLNVGLPAGYLPSLKSIRIWECGSMVSVFPTNGHQPIDTSYPSLQSICILNCPRVESFSGMEVPSNLKQLSVTDCKCFGITSQSGVCKDSLHFKAYM